MKLIKNKMILAVFYFSFALALFLLILVNEVVLIVDVKSIYGRAVFLIAAFFSLYSIANAANLFLYKKTFIERIIEQNQKRDI